MKSKYPTYYFLPFLACFYLGCGGGDGSQNEPANGNATSGKPSGGDTKVALAGFLPGKRIYVVMDSPFGGGETSAGGDATAEDEPSPSKEAASPPEAKEDKGEGDNECDEPQGETRDTTPSAPSKKMEMVLQFEKDGKFTIGRVSKDGTVFSLGDDDLTYKVSDPQKVTVFERGTADGGVSFPTTHPKIGDEIKFGPEKDPRSAVISKLEDAGPMETRGEDDDAGDPDFPANEPAPEGKKQADE